MKDYLSPKGTKKYDIFRIFGKDGISFSYKYDITFLPKRQRWSSPKEYISSIIEEDHIHPRKHGISSDRKIKDDIKFTHSNTHREN